jgi:hypothetical protein
MSHTLQAFRRIAALARIEAKVLAGSFRGRLETAYMYVLPTTSMPDPVITKFLNDLGYALHFKPYYVVSDKLGPGNTVFEAHSRNPEKLRDLMIRMLPHFGWQADAGRTPELLLCRKGKLSFHLMFLNEG